MNLAARAVGYTYDALPTRDSIVRLLTLLPGSFHEDIQVSLATVTLKTARLINYDALSYTWGTSIRDQKIYIRIENDSRTPQYRYVLVTPNLAEACRYLRLEGSPRVFWIDAVCIDQNNTDERGPQVRLMPDVFKYSFRVIVWLGPEADDSTYCFSYLNRLASENEQSYLRSGRQAFAENRMPLHYTTREYQSVKALFDRPWFERVWIMQEIQHGRDKGIVWCGRDSITWVKFHIAAVIIRQSHKGQSGPEWRKFEDRSSIIAHLGSSVMNSLTPLLRDSSRMKCADPRDKIFAILGMLPPKAKGIADVVEPDYNKSVPEVCLEWFRAMTTYRQSYVTLATWEPNDQSNRPSWVPDLDTPQKRPGVAIDWQYADANAKIDSITVNLGPILEVMGVNVATVTSAKTLDFETNEPHHVSAQLKKLFEKSSPSEPDFRYRDIVEAFSFTFCRGRYRESRIPPAWDAAEMSFSTFSQEFQRLLQDIGHAPPAALQDSRPNMNVFARMRTSCRDRVVIKTSEGHIGVAPAATRPGDIVIVLISCPTLLILHPLENGRHILIGPSYVHGLNWSEGLCGPLLKPYRCVRKAYPVRGWDTAFVNEETGRDTMLDPRIVWDELEVPKSDPRANLWSFDEAGQPHKHYRKPDLAYFRRHGADIQSLYLE